MQKLTEYGTLHIEQPDFDLGFMVAWKHFFGKDRVKFTDISQYAGIKVYPLEDWTPEGVQKAIMEQMADFYKALCELDDPYEGVPHFVIKPWAKGYEPKKWSTDELDPDNPYNKPFSQWLDEMGKTNEPAPVIPV